MTDYIGHDKYWSMFKNAYEQDSLHHGWILSGLRGLGKAGFARRMAVQILDPLGQHNALFEAGSHPDLHIVSRPPKEAPKAGEGISPDAELKRSINIDQIRKLQSILTTKAAMSDKRVIIIDAADDMERNGANAILKSLEEPPAGTIFILISHSSEKLLPTIKSRCQMMRFDPLNDEMLGRVLDHHIPDISADEKRALIKAGGGSPGQALAFIGLDMAEIENAMDQVRMQGDTENIISNKLVKSLTLKAAQPKYEAFLRRVPSYIAYHANDSPINAIPNITEAHNAATELASRAIGLSLDKPSVVFQMVSLLSKLQTHKSSR